MQLCPLKGWKRDMRVSYSKRVAIPKACFQNIPSYTVKMNGRTYYNIFKAAKTKSDCDAVSKQKKRGGQSHVCEIYLPETRLRVSARPNAVARVDVWMSAFVLDSSGC